MPKKQQANNGGGKNRKIGRNERKYGKSSEPDRFIKSREKRHSGPLGWYRAETQADQEVSRARRAYMDAERHYELVQDDWTSKNLVGCRQALEAALAKKNFCHKQREHMNRNSQFFLRELLPWPWFKRASKVRVRRVRAIWGWVPLELDD